MILMNLLCEIVPALLRPYVRELGQHLRTQQEYVNEQKIKISDYEQYIENWAHEIKKPLSLMTLLLDNRKTKCPFSAYSYALRA